MAGPKAQTPAPIDRPLSRAYLREFSGWSSMYPPGLSDPTSLRIMENVMVNRDGSARIRPGMRYLSYSVLPIQGETAFTPGNGIGFQVIGSHEAFYGPDGGKVYLFAVREADSTVGFRCLVTTPLGQLVVSMSDPRAGFTGIGAGLNFSAATTYVKYLQIDNKIFALSNAGEPMRLFFVGATKTAKALGALSRPAWSVADKLTVVQPDAPWITAGAPTGVRTNLLTNPDFETNVLGYSCVGPATLTRDTSVHQVGTASGRLDVAPTIITNLFTNPSFTAAGLGGWSAGSGSAAPTNTGSKLSLTQSNAGAGGRMYVNGPRLAVTAGKKYSFGTTVHRLPGYGSGWGAGATGFLYRWYNAADAQIGADVDITASIASDSSRAFGVTDVTAPAGATGFRMFAYTTKVYSSSFSQYYGDFDITNTYFNDGNAGFFSGANLDSSTYDYAWTGVANASSSTRTYLGVTELVTDLMVTTPGAFTYSTYIQAPIALSGALQIRHYSDAAGTVLLGTSNASLSLTTGLTRFSVSGTAPAGTVRSRAVFVPPTSTTLTRSFYLDAGLFEAAAAMGTYFSGASTSSSTLVYAWSGSAHGSTSTETTWSTGATIPAKETATLNTLVSSDNTKNVYNFGFFYTFENEVGESAASQITSVRAQRGWSAWRWEAPNAAGEPNGTTVSDPTAAADQLIASMPQAVFDTAVLEGAIRWNLYAFTWSDQDPVPVVALKLGSKDLKTGAAYGTYGWQAMTPQMANAGSDLATLPNEKTRYNYSDPSKAGQGLVASDRMVMVYDPTSAAVIRWSGNNQGDYSNFSSSKGGGYKTLTSGNLYVPACVKLWQNPQSVDTLTILCMGTDGQSTGYYMAPATVSSQSEQQTIMGFEETTATPGTTSPYGCEVMNNALYHPLDEQLMKSTATSYNINHKSQTDQIQNVWERLVDKHHIVSAAHDNRIYYVVHNPDGADLQNGCWGNEIWVLDAGATAGTWSRWLIQAQSLRKIEQDGRIYMSVVRPDGIFYLDPDYASDDYVALDNTIKSQPIAWSLETNTQGANRAHDAPAHVQQVNLVLGNFTGQMEYGIRAVDIHGRKIDRSKIVRDDGARTTLTWDLQDYFELKVDMVEWFFYARSVTDEDGVVQPSSGQINLVQYRYTPVSVNVGYAFGSIETFEYGRAAAGATDYSTNGTPLPYIDTARP